MTLSPGVNQKVNMRRKRSLHDADQKTSSKKWCYHPAHEGVLLLPQTKKRCNSRLMKPKCFPSSQKTLDIIYGLFDKDPETLKEILQETRPVIRKNWCNCTLLHIAVRHDLIEMVKMLQELISPNALNRYSQTAAHIAALRGNVELLKILLANEEFDPNKRDIWHRTYKDCLSAPLFMAVLWCDTNQIEELLELGANPDGHAGKLVDGVVVRELKVSTPRHLAIALNRESIVERFAKVNVTDISQESGQNVFPINDDGCRLINDMNGLPKAETEVLIDQNMSATDKFKIDTTARGFVSIFTYGSFKDRQDLTYDDASNNDANNLAKVFSELGYNGDIHSSLTAEETKEALMKVRDMEMLRDVGCAIFYFSSRVISEDSFLTSDRKHLSIESILDLFKDSKCPQLKNKPKIFIFDLCKQPRDKENGQGINGYSEGKDGDAQVSYPTRSKGRLQDTIFIYSSLKNNCSHNFSRDGSAFNKALCDTLSNHGQSKELTHLYKELMKEISKMDIDNKSYLLKYGFEKEFYFSTEHN